jgi:hypothetical protein
LLLYGCLLALKSRDLALILAIALRKNIDLLGQGVLPCQEGIFFASQHFVHFGLAPACHEVGRKCNPRRTVTFRKQACFLCGERIDLVLQHAQ